MSEVPGRPAVSFIALGGTISMTGGDAGLTPSLSGQDLVASVPGLDAVAQVSALSPFRKPGASLTLDDLRAVADLARHALADGAAGVVVVQGTDTIEETAFVLDRLLPATRPVVVTGAMRGPQAAGADGPANLLAAAIVAGSGVQGLGTVVVLNDQVHAARHVAKRHTALPSAFGSDPFGPVGHVIEGRFCQAHTLPPLPGLTLPKGAQFPPVALLGIGLGDDGRLLDGLADAGFAGAVIAATGAGHVPEIMVPRLQALADVMPVILGSRVAGGPVFHSTYGFPGSERDLLARGLIAGGGIGPWKARLLLQLALAAGMTRVELTRLFHHL
jgi:L-asparaginase